MSRFLLLLLLSCLVHAQLVIGPYAGMLPRSGVPAPQSGFGGVTDLAWDRDGNLLFADSQMNVVWRLRSTGIAEVVAGTGEAGYSGDGGPATGAKLWRPTQIRTDDAGNLYIVDAFNYRIRKVDTNGVITTVVGTGIPLVVGQNLEGRGTEVPILLSGGGFAVDAAGNVYFADDPPATNARAIRRVDPNGDVRVIAGILTPNCGYCSDGDGGPAVSAHITAANALSVDRAGNVYVVDGRTFYDNAMIRKIVPGGTISRLINTYGTVAALLVADDGSIYAPVGYSGDVSPNATIGTVKFGPNGNVLSKVSDFFTRPYLNPQREVVLRSGDRLIDAATGAEVFKLPVRSTSPEGVAAADAMLPQFAWMAVNRKGEVHFVELCRVRKFDAEMKLRTVAGVETCNGPAPALPNISSIAFGPDDRLWIRAEGRTFVVESNGVVTEQPVRRDLGVEPWIAVDGKGRLHVMGSDYLNRLELDGTVKIVVKDLHQDTTSDLRPTGIGVDAQGTVYFTGRGGLYRIQEDGSYTNVFSQSVLVNNKSLSVDGQGRAWTGFSVTDAIGTARVNSVTVSAMGPDGAVYGFDGARILRLDFSRARPRPAITPGGIVSSASYTADASFGTLVAIFGSNFGGVGIQGGSVENNRFPDAVAGTKVFFSGAIALAGRITAVTPTQINVFVPQSVWPSLRTIVQVQVDDKVSEQVFLDLQFAAPQLYTADASGKGQGAIVNQSGTVNSRNNPAARGSVVSLYGTGGGRTTPEIADGAAVLSKPYPALAEMPVVRIGDAVAEVTYAGGAPGLATGVFQINARIPNTVPTGDVEIVVTMQGKTSKPVTVAVQ